MAKPPIRSKALPPIPNDFSLEYCIKNFTRPYRGRSRKVLTVAFRELAAEKYKYNPKEQRFYKRG